MSSHLYRVILSRIAQAEVDTGGSGLVVILGEVLGVELARDLGYLPDRIATYPVNPYAWGPWESEILIITAPVDWGAHGGWHSDTVVRETLATDLSVRELETYRVLRQSGMEPAEAYAAAQALERE